MIAQEFKEAYKTGRVAMYVMDLGWESNMLVLVLYGVPGGGNIARAKTEALIDTIIKEKETKRNGVPFCPLPLPRRLSWMRCRA